MLLKSLNRFQSGRTTATSIQRLELLAFCGPYRELLSSWHIAVVAILTAHLFQIRHSIQFGNINIRIHRAV